MGTHDVTNQPPPLAEYNVFLADHPLREALRSQAPALESAQFVEIGELAGSSENIQLGFDADTSPPVLQTHDRFGRRIDEVRFHPAWHALMMTATRYGLHASPWLDPSPHAHLSRAAKFYVWSQVEAGHGCPISMTYASVPALRHNATLANEWVPKLAARSYDPRLTPIAKKQSALCGMGMTEKQGGSDVRSNQTRATATRDGNYLLRGHKWFCSAPMNDAFLVLAQSAGGLSCFFVPRVLPDGSRNAFAIQRLKNKLGNRSNASSEVEFDKTQAWLVGEEGRGVQTIVEMVNHTRLDCAIGSAALMRASLAQAIHHATYRHAFGSALVDHALMQNVLADLALESEAATVLWIRLAIAVDQGPRDERSAALARIGVAIAKYYLCKRAPIMSAEALECLGGNGYVEESIMPRLYREAPLNSIWEGSANVIALDVLRVLRTRPDAYEALRAELSPVLSNRIVAQAAQSLEREVATRGDAQGEALARTLVERMAMLWQSSLLLQYAPSEVAETFIASRVAGEWGHAFGTLHAQAPLRPIVERAAPRE
jgi:putative acyl-CoA dehydrogenase